MRGTHGALRRLSVDFAVLYQRHRDVVYRLALRYGSGRSAWAEDMVQDVFIAALEDAKFSSGQCDAGAWLYRVTTNRCLTRLKRERLSRMFSAVLGGGRAVEHRTPERAYGGSEALTALELWLARLPATEKVVFSMHVQDAKSQVEIAAILGFSRGYVSKLLARVESKLAGLPEGRVDV
jgi:RNA polymerase sigma-70 factor, ECF subfamily